MVNRVDSELITQQGHRTSSQVLQAAWGAALGGEVETVRAGAPDGGWRLRGGLPRMPGLK